MLENLTQPTNWNTLGMSITEKMCPVKSESETEEHEHFTSQAERNKAAVTLSVIVNQNSKTHTSGTL